MPLLFSFGVVDVALEFVLGVLDVDELVLPDGVDDAFDDDAFVSDEDDDGGVPDVVDDEDGVVDDELSLALPVLGVVVDDDDDIEPLGAGVVDDDDDVDGAGVTVGGVVLVVEVFDVSRLQPAIPRTRPLTSTVTNAVFIAISNG